MLSMVFFNRTVTLSYYNCREFSISQVSFCVEEKRRKNWSIQAILQKLNMLHITSCFRDLHSKVTKRDIEAPKRKPQGFIFKVNFLKIMQKATVAPRGNGAGTFFFLVYMHVLLLLILYPIPILCGRIKKLHSKSSLSDILMTTYDTSDPRYLLSLVRFYCLGLAIKLQTCGLALFK